MSHPQTEDVALVMLGQFGDGVFWFAAIDTSAFPCLSVPSVVSGLHGILFGYFSSVSSYDLVFSCDIWKPIFYGYIRLAWDPLNSDADSLENHYWADP